MTLMPSKQFPPHATQRLLVHIVFGGGGVGGTGDVGVVVVGDLRCNDNGQFAAS